VAWRLEAVGARDRAGVPISAGTDQSVPGHRLHRKPELYVKVGMTPLEAIRSATIVPASWGSCGGHLGTSYFGRSQPFQHPFHISSATAHFRIRR
jgi:imidazolonepropionase-like amidohydrolase